MWFLPCEVSCDLGDDLLPLYLFEGVLRGDEYLMVFGGGSVESFDLPRLGFKGVSVFCVGVWWHTLYVVEPGTVPQHPSEYRCCVFGGDGEVFVSGCRL